MTSVFIAGSRKLSRLNEQVQKRLENVMAGSYVVLVGDANGADKAVQKFLFERNYRNVTVYCSGSVCRNNLGNWESHHVEVDPKISGRDFYTKKDIEMAVVADYGLMIWDGKSPGTINNVLELVKRDKKALVYLSSLKQFFAVSSLEDINQLLSHCSDDDFKLITRKTGLNSKLRDLAQSNQHALGF